VLGYEREDVVGEWFGDFLTDTSTDEFESNFERFKSEGEVAGVEFEMVTDDGRTLVVVFDGRIQYDDDGEFVRTHCQFRDVTERVRRERRLRRMERAVAASGHAVYLTDSDGTIEYVNDRFEGVTGYSAEESLGRNPRILNSGEMPDEYYEDLWETLLSGDVWEEEIVNRRKNGEHYHAHQTIAPVTDEEDTIEGFVAIQTDITERKQREQRLERYKRLVENVPLGVYRNTPGADGEFTMLNEAMVEIFDAESAAELQGCTVSDLYQDPDDRAAFSRMLSEQGVVRSAELALETLDGEEIWGAVTAVASDVDGDTVYDGVVRDITERKEMEAQLKQREERFRTMFERHSAPMMLIEPDTGVIRRANAAARDFYGYSADELTSMDIQEINQLSPEEVAHERQRARREDRNHFVFEHELASGAVRTVEVHSSPIETDDETLLFSVIHDITERRDQQRELSELKERLNLAVDSADIGVWDWDMTTDEVEFNEQWARLLGHASDETATRLEALKQQIHPNDLDEVETALEAHTAGDADRFDTEHRMRTADGEWKWVRSVGKVFERDDDGEPVRAVGILTDIDDRKERERELERYEQLIENVPAGIFRTKPTESGEFAETNPALVEMFDASSADQLLDTAVRDLFSAPDRRESLLDTLFEDGVVEEEVFELETFTGDSFWGAITGVVFHTEEQTYIDGVVQDITERIEYEQQLEEQRDNLEVLNEMVRHDIRNDLQLILAYADMLTEDLDDEHQEYVEIVLENAKSAAELTKTARDLAETMLKQESNVKPVALRGVLESQIEELRTTHGGAVVTVDGTVPSVQVSADEMLDSVFRNILTNAVTHNDKDVPKIEVSVREADGDVVVTVADNGPGVPDDRKDEIFGKGTKSLESEGTGIGLYLVNTLVERYGGDVWVTDNTPEGAMFHLRLPTDT
jgi:PAS domain S-box-containing protein